MRSAWRPMMMICSAPSRFAAITPQRPTAPSPTTATRLARRRPRDDGGVVAGAHHVGEREQRRHQRVVLADRQDVERAVGERDAQRLGLRAVGTSLLPKKPPWTHAVCRPSSQNTQVPSENANGMTTTSPRLTVRTSRADVLDDADRLVAHAPAPSSCGPVDW